MKAILRTLPLILLPLFVGCDKLPTDNEAGSTSPAFAKGGNKPPKDPPGGDGTPADPAIAYLDRYDLKVMNEDGSNQTTVFTTETYTLSGTPSWSPDGTRLALRGPYPDPPLVVVDLVIDPNGIPVGSPPTPLTLEQVFDAAWSPTSDIIAYTGVVDGDNRYLMTVSADGGPGTSTIVYETPTQPCGVWHPTWYPDGSQIAFVIECDGLVELRILTLTDAPTQDALSLIPEGYFIDLAFPEWSRDGTRIVFGGRETSSSDYAVYIVDVADPASETYGAWHELGLRSPYGIPGAPWSWSPDDSKLVVDLDRAVRVVDADPDSPTYGQVIPKRKSKLASGGHPNWRRCAAGLAWCGLKPSP